MSPAESDTGLTGNRAATPSALSRLHYAAAAAASHKLPTPMRSGSPSAPAPSPPAINTSSIRRPTSDTAHRPVLGTQTPAADRSHRRFHQRPSAETVPARISALARHTANRHRAASLPDL